ncbi:MAG: hypothetical protein IT328_07295 [Caldilineaceae bacterium]|nr:hypothetical protein [Caldilineaceae bacterium]
MFRRFIAPLLIGLIFIALLGIVFAPETSLIAQAPANEPDFPLCSAGLTQVLAFGPGELLRPVQSNPEGNLEDNFSFNVPAGAGPQGEVLVWQGEGHHWDQGCNIGPGNDNGAPRCDSDQLLEIITFTVNGDAIGQFVDHTPDTDNNYLYTFTVNSLVEGTNDLGLHHLNEGTGANSVFYKGVVCAVVADTPTPTPTNTNTPTPTATSPSDPTSTPTSTPTATATSPSDATPTPTSTATSTPTATATPTPTDDSGPTNLDPVDQPGAPDQPGQFCSNGHCQFLPFVLER